MTFQTINPYVQIICAGIMLAAPIALIIYVYSREAHFMTLRVIQFLALAEIVPAVVILGLQQVLDKSAAGTILAGVAGYVLGNGGGSGGGGGTTKPDNDPDKGHGTAPSKLGQGGETAEADAGPKNEEDDFVIEGVDKEGKPYTYRASDVKLRGAASSLSSSG